MIDTKRMSAKILFWDLETTNLNANYGYVLAFGYKFLGDKTPTVKTIAEYNSFKKSVIVDKELLQEAFVVLSQADMWVTWYGKRFDVPYINARLLKYNLGFLPPIPHVDGWEIARKKLRLNSNRLQSVSEFLGLANKTPVLGDQWIAAAAGSVKGIKYVADHCRRDVDILEQAYLKLRPLMRNHPYLARLRQGYEEKGLPLNQCQVCESQGCYVRRGKSVTLTRVYQRYCCKKCGSWTQQLLQEK